jgi:hypothetical protein
MEKPGLAAVGWIRAIEIFFCFGDPSFAGGIFFLPMRHGSPHGTNVGTEETSLYFRRLKEREQLNIPA